MTEDISNNRPLVTFALFAYNQEQYIREAVEGAFSQTYEPLEIILSDDCSTDRTFEIMQEMATAYEGPHEVRVSQTDRNLGVTPHVLLRGEEARGEIVVVAAGDDISKPNRCSAHVQCYHDASVMAVSGGYDLIDENSEILKSNVTEPVAKHALEEQRKIFKNLEFPYAVIQGSTASYRKLVFSFPLPPWNISFSEDNLFNFLIYANGYQVAVTSEALIQYRMHPEALSNHGRIKRSALEIEIGARDAAIKNLQKINTYAWVATKAGDVSILNMREIEKCARRAGAIQSWPQTEVLERSLSLIASLATGDLRMTKWKLARLFGKFPRYQPKNLSVYWFGR